MSELPKSKWAKPAKAEPAMPEATKAELTKADLANAEPAMPEATKAELTKADLANADLANADLANTEFAMSELTISELTISELEPEFRDQHRIDLLTALKAALKEIPVDKVTSVLWAHLWLSDIDMLEALVKSNMNYSLFFLVNAELPGAVVKRCEFMNFHIFS
jgi:Pentapeptide repeats (8 copies)